MSTFYQHLGANLPTPNINICLSGCWLAGAERDGATPRTDGTRIGARRASERARARRAYVQYIQAKVRLGETSCVFKLGVSENYMQVILHEAVFRVSPFLDLAVLRRAYFLAAVRQRASGLQGGGVFHGSARRDGRNGRRDKRQVLLLFFAHICRGGWGEVRRFWFVRACRWRGRKWHNHGYRIGLWPNPQDSIAKKKHAKRSIVYSLYRAIVSSPVCVEVAASPAEEIRR